MDLPLHPILVHFPIGLLFASGLCWILLHFTRIEFLRSAALLNLFIGIIGVAAAVLSGLQQEDRITHNEIIHEIMETHEVLGFVALALFVVMFLWGYFHRTKMQRTEQGVYLLVFIGGLIALGYSGHLGGQMVYLHGAGVEPMRAVITAAEGQHEHQHQH